jgi:hypothetical protein
MKRFVPAFGVPLILAFGLGQGDTRRPAALPPVSDYGRPTSLAPLPWMLAQSKTPHAPVPGPRITVRPNPAVPYVQSPRAPGDIIPHAYMVFGLRTGPGGMAFTDGNGAVIPVPSNPNIYMGPFTGPPAIPSRPTSPPAFTLPRLIPLPIPKK